MGRAPRRQLATKSSGSRPAASRPLRARDAPHPAPDPDPDSPQLQLSEQQEQASETRVQDGAHVVDDASHASRSPVRPASVVTSAAAPPPPPLSLHLVASPTPPSPSESESRLPPKPVSQQLRELDGLSDSDADVDFDRNSGRIPPSAESAATQAAKRLAEAEQERQAREAEDAEESEYVVTAPMIDSTAHDVSAASLVPAAVGAAAVELSPQLDESERASVDGDDADDDRTETSSAANAPPKVPRTRASRKSARSVAGSQRQSAESGGEESQVSAEAPAVITRSSGKRVLPTQEKHTVVEAFISDNTDSQDEGARRRTSIPALPVSDSDRPPAERDAADSQPTDSGTPPPSRTLRKSNRRQKMPPAPAKESPHSETCEWRERTARGR